MAVASKAAIPSRSRSSHTRTTVHVFPIDRFAPHAIHRCRQLTIRPVPTQFAHHLHGAEMTVIGISATPNLGDANLTMAATIPMDNQDDLIRLVIVVQHALLNQNPCESLFGSCVGAERVPGSR